MNNNMKVNTYKLLLAIIAVIASFNGNAQNPQTYTLEYDYDDSGNRINRKILSVLKKEPNNRNWSSDNNNIPELKEIIASENGTICIGMYPNPIKDFVNIKISNISNKAEGKFTIYSNNGQILISGKINSTQTFIDVNNLSAGKYYVNIQLNEYDKVINFTLIKL